MSFKGKTYHCKAMMIVGEPFVCLPRILGRDKEPHVVSIQLSERRLSKLNVGKVYRVERASEKNGFQVMS